MTVTYSSQASRSGQVVPSAVPAAEGEYEQVIATAMAADFDAYRARLPEVETPPINGRWWLACPVFPHPTEPGGLPEGWATRWGPPRDSTEATTARMEMFVVERLAGGWGIVMHGPHDNTAKPLMRTKLWVCVSSTIDGLHHAAMRTARIGFEDPEQTIRAFVLSAYDTTHPVEEAEATLVGLGGPITVLPSSLTGQTGDCV